MRLVVHMQNVIPILKTARVAAAVDAVAEDMDRALPISSYTDGDTGSERYRAAVIARGSSAEETREQLLRALPMGGG